MSAPIVCPRCGFANQAGWTYCTNCGSPMVPSFGAPTAGPAAPPQAYPPTAYPPTYAPPAAAYPAYPPYPGYPPYAYGPPPWEVERAKQIDRTKWGVLLLLFGALISWIPIVGAIGGLLTLIGVILVIVGRKAFGATHRRNVVISIVLFFVGLAFIIVGAIVAVFAALGAVSSATSEAELAAALRDAFTNVLIIAVVGSFVSGLASVFFTYALQKREGRIVLWAAYGATLGVQVAIVVVTLPLIPDIAAAMARQIVATGTVDSTAVANAVSGAASGLALLNGIPSILYALANYLAWSRITKGEIPERPTPAAVPAASPPAPPINPQ